MIPLARLASENCIVEIFRKMGFGALDARVYTVLLSKGPLTISQLMGELDAYRPQLHNSLNRLLARGFVEVNRGKPTLYRAVNPQVVIDTFKAEMSKLEDEALKYLQKLGSESKRTSGGIWILRSRMGLYRRYLDAIRGAKTDLLVCGSASFVKRLLKPLLEAQERGVLVYALVYVPPNKPLDSSIVEPLSQLQRVKVVVSGDHFIIRDSSMAVISYSKWRAMGGERGMVVEEPIMIAYLERDFLKNWTLARVIRNDEISLPARFTFYGLAIIEAHRLLSSGIGVRGEFHGWWVATGEEDTIEGDILDVVVSNKMGVIMHFIVKTENGIIRVGGPDAVVEEFAAQTVYLERKKDAGSEVFREEFLVPGAILAEGFVGGS